ncbi:hypothetical protein EJB05_01848, partial [Eragrostis curvula]
MVCVSKLIVDLDVMPAATIISRDMVIFSDRSSFSCGYIGAHRGASCGQDKPDCQSDSITKKQEYRREIVWYTTSIKSTT